MFYQTSASILLCTTLALFQLTKAHTVITYPGWRGDNLHSNGTVEITDGVQPYELGNGSSLFPYGMQWSYPCGGMPMSQNRTNWPVKGGAVAFQPGWFTGHPTALIYINLGYGNVPVNYSNVMYGGLQIVGPTSQPYPGTFCLPQVPLPANHTAKVGDNATIQIIETALHGAALYNCVDITFTEPEDVAEVNETNCFNSTQLNAALWYTTPLLLNGAESTMGSPRLTYVAAILAAIGAWTIL